MTNYFMTNIKRTFSLLAIAALTIPVQCENVRIVNSRPNNSHFMYMLVNAYYRFNWETPSSMQELQDFAIWWTQYLGMYERYHHLIRKINDKHYKSGVNDQNVYILMYGHGKELWSVHSDICSEAFSTDQIIRQRFLNQGNPVLRDSTGKLHPDLNEEFMSMLDSVTELYPKRIIWERCHTTSRIVLLNYSKEKGMSVPCGGESFNDLTNLASTYLKAIELNVEQFLVSHSLESAKFYLTSLRECD